MSLEKKNNKKQQKAFCGSKMSCILNTSNLFIFL